MYLPEQFFADEATVSRILATFGAAELVTCTNGVYDATTTPMVFHPEVGEHGVLRGHLSRDNLQWQHAGDALVIIRGVDGYITPTFYPSAQEHGQVVPTWSYETVNVHGTLTAIDDANWLNQHLRSLTEKYEAYEPVPWSVDDTPDGYIAKRFVSLIGVEFAITRIDAKAKLSQTKPVKDVAGVIAGLDARGDAALRDATRNANRDRL